MRKYLIFILSICVLLLSCKKDNGDDEIIQLTEIPQGYIAKYSLNDNATDYSENQNHGEITGSVLPTYNRYQSIHSAMYFRTDQSYINVDGSDELNLLNSYTISVWVRAASIGDRWKTILSKWGWGNGYFLGLNPDNSQLRFRLGSNIIETETPFPVDQWTHIAITHNASDFKIYINGTVSKELSIENEMSGTHYPFRIGGQDGYSGGTSFDGAIDDVLIYDRALTSEEISELNNGNY